MMIAIILLVLLGLVAAVFGSIVGLGGGIIIVPALILFGPMLTGEPIGHGTAVGTSLAVLIFTALASTLSYMKDRRVDFRIACLLFITSGPAAMLGSALTGRFAGGAFQIAFGVFMLLMAALLILRERLKPASRRWPIRRVWTDAAGNAHEYGFAYLPGLAVGFLVGLVSGLFGIGGGSLFVPVMVLLFNFPPHVATATSMFTIFLSALLGSGVKAALGEIDWLLAAALVPGAWIGGRIGARIARRMSGRGLLWLLRATLLVLAIRMMWDGFRAL
jgi:hypothetical protein